MTNWPSLCSLYCCKKHFRCRIVLFEECLGLVIKTNQFSKLGFECEFSNTKASHCIDIQYSQNSFQIADCLATYPVPKVKIKNYCTKSSIHMFYSQCSVFTSLLCSDSAQKYSGPGPCSFTDNDIFYQRSLKIFPLCLYLSINLNEWSSLFTITLRCGCSYAPPKFDLQIAWLCPCNSHVNLVSEVNAEYCPHVWSHGA